MIRMSTLVVAGIAALPLVVAAQTANQPGGQVSTGTAIDQTTKSQPAAKTTSTSPDVNNPTGSLPSKSGVPATNTATPTGSMTSTTSLKPRAAKQTATTKTGDVPTYPAPAPDGTPTK